jgi:hypothetical protein
MYAVDVSRNGEALKRIAAANLRRVGALQPGDTAEVHGLSGDPELMALNGLTARIKDYVAENALFVVDVLFDAAKGEDEDEDDRAKSPEVRKTASFFEFSLCLSRACLGKMIVFTYKWLKNAVFRRNFG